jgi:hypothetical protein
MGEQMIDFEKMQEEVLFDIDDDDEKEEILEGIEKVKTMSEEEIRKIAEYLDSLITEQAIDEEEMYGGAASDFAASKMLALYLENHPNESKDDFNEDAYDQFRSGHYKEEKAALVEAIFNENLMDDNVLDEIQRQCTDKAAEEYGLHRNIIRFINPSGL